MSKMQISLIEGVKLIIIAAVLSLTACTQKEEYSGYLFTYFTGNGPGEEAIRYAISSDGYNFRALNNNQPIVDSKAISTSGGVRDPHILRGNDGNFYMVVTDLYVPEMGWRNYAMVLMKSTDMVTWESSVVNIPEIYPEKFGSVYRVWAPQTIFDKATGKYMVYFSMKEGDDPDKIYYAYANADFTGFEAAPKQLYFPPEYSNNRACIDGDIVEKDGLYYLFHKAEDGAPGIKLAISDQLTEGYELVSTDRVDKETNPVEGSGIFKLIDSDAYILMYDVYTSGRYQFTKSNDLKNFTIIDEDISMDFHARHGTVMAITKKEMTRLIENFGKPGDDLFAFDAPEIKQINIDVNTDEQTILLPVKGGADLTAFDPMLKTRFDVVSVSPSGAQDFSKGPVTYTVKAGEVEWTYKVTVEQHNNPVLTGYYADPDILYAEKTGKYYIYPTSDGFWGWSGTYFKTFSSENLVDWTDEGVILDLKKDVSWANRNAWAPCIVEKKIDGQYKYFYYFTAAQSIGVAVADDPTGPFVDSGKVLIDWKPEGITRGQVIDPDVFTDPVSGKSYLYWGNGWMAAAELNDDMVSLNLNTFKVMNTDRTYREGTYVIFRGGTYYFMWSEDDTRSPNYKVRYATSDSPLGKLVYPENNIVIRRDDAQRIYGAGHHSVLQVPGTDEWYIVYHRFNRPKGLAMGRAAGFHREVCIDHLYFDEEGKIIEAKPTVKGIEPIK